MKHGDVQEVFEKSDNQKMNLHKEITRRKLILAFMVASALMAVAMCVVVRQRQLHSEPSVPASADVYKPASSSSDMTNSAIDSQTTTTTEQTTTTTEQPTTTTTSTTQPKSDGDRTECKGKLTVETDSANVRDDANGEARFLREIHKGETYKVIAQKTSPTGVLWYEMEFDDGTTGYVSGSYVRYDGQVVGGKVYLTFDDGPSDNTRRILDTLDKYGVKATFFVIYHKGFDDVYRDIVNRGHVIALHSYSHDYAGIYKSEKAFFGDLDKLDKFIHELTGVHSKTMRFPGGSSNTISRKHCEGIMTRLTQSVGERGYRYYDWDVDSGDADAVTVPADKILGNIKRSMGNRREAIILMHDGKTKTTTADALPQIIEYLQERGYEILPITEDTHQSHQRVNN